MTKHKAALLLALLMAASCPAMAQETASTLFHIHAQVSGLNSGDTVVLENTSGGSADKLAISSDGDKIFKRDLPDGAAYNLDSAATYTPNLSCTVSNAKGTVHHADVTSIKVACTHGGAAVQNVTGGSSNNGQSSILNGQPELDQSGANSDLTANGDSGAPSLSVGQEQAGGNNQASDNASAPTLADANDGESSLSVSAPGSQDVIGGGAGKNSKQSGASGSNGQSASPNQSQQQSSKELTITLVGDTSKFTFYKGIAPSPKINAPIRFKLSGGAIGAELYPKSQKLPGGMSLSSAKASAKISGEPSKYAHDETHAYTLVAYNDTGMSNPLTIHITVADPPTISISEKSTPPFLLTAGIPLSGAEKYNKPIYLKLSGGVVSVEPLPEGLKFKAIQDDLGELTGTPSYSPNQDYALVAYNKDKIPSRPLNVKIAATGCGDHVVDQASQNASPVIEQCIETVENYDSSTKPKTVGGKIAFRPGVYTLKTQLDLTPNDKDISSFTFKTAGISLTSTQKCAIPANVKEKYAGNGYSGEYDNDDSGPSCAIFMAAPNFLGGIPGSEMAQVAKNGDGGVVYTSQGHTIYDSVFDHVIIDGNHQHRNGGTLFSDCAHRPGTPPFPLGFNASLRVVGTTFHYFQAVDALCGSTMNIGVGSGGVTFDACYVGHNGGLYDNGSSIYYAANYELANSDGLVVENSIMEDSRDVSMTIGQMHHVCPQKGSPLGVPGKVINNKFIQHGPNHSVYEIMLNNWSAPKTGYFENTCGGKTLVKDNYVDCDGPGATPNNSYCGSGIRLGNEPSGEPQGPIIGGNVEDNTVVCTGNNYGGEGITFHQASGYNPNIMSVNKIENSCGGN